MRKDASNVFDCLLRLVLVVLANPIEIVLTCVMSMAIIFLARMPVPKFIRELVFVTGSLGSRMTV